VNIYLVIRSKYSYDDYDSFVCVAPSEYFARRCHPDETLKFLNGIWVQVEDHSPAQQFDIDSWVEPSEIDTLKVTYLGKAESPEPRVVLASFNAG